MKVTVLAENTAAREDMVAEHGLSLLVETDSTTLLCDGGQSAALLKNAAALGKSLAAVEVAVLSHGHYDHATGLSAFVAAYPAVPLVLRAEAGREFYHGERYIGIDKTLCTLPQTRVIADAGVTELGHGVSVFSGFGDGCRPLANAGLTVRDTNGERADDFCHEQAVVVCEGDKRVLFSGCAHSGMEAILARFSALYGGVPTAVFSGFHTMKQEPYTEAEMADLRALAETLSGTGAVFYTGHCTGDAAFAVMKPRLCDRLLRMRCGDTVTI